MKNYTSENGRWAPMTPPVDLPCSYTATYIFKIAHLSQMLRVVEILLSLEVI